MPAPKRPARLPASRRPAAPAARKRPAKPAVCAAAPAPAAFLPFTRPTIDEETIAGVAEVLRSGWITSGPAGEGLRGEALGVLRRPPGARLQLRHLHDGDRAADRRRRPGRRGHHDPAHLGGDEQRHPRGRRAAGLRRHRSGDAQHRPRPRRGGDHARAPAPIIPVDLAGPPVDRDRLYALARRHKLRVVEDAAQAFGSTWSGRRIGSFGDFVSFSFHANKNITTIEGGCLVLNDEREARLAEQYRLQGVVRSGYDGMEVELVGGKFNLTDVAARIGLGQLPHLEDVHREAPRAGPRLLRGLRRARGPRARPGSARRRFRRTATGTCSRWCCPRSG